MDFSRLQSLQYELNATNATATNIPSTILELVVPGYSTISQLAFKFLGIDIGVLVTGWVLIFGCRTAWSYTYDLVQGYLDEHYTSSIQIDDDDGLFEYVKAWLAEQKTRRPMRKLKAVTDYEDKNKNDNDHNDDGGIYKYEVPIPRYELTYGVDNEFYYCGRYFKVVRSSEKDDYRGRLKESLEIYCYGQTTQPIKDLLLHIRQWKMKQETAMTSVFRPLSGGYWSRQSSRPSRSLHTVSLDQDQKEQIVDDVNEYLHPATARWYAARGIPHRRGYLFHGPPGTGKTSLSFALAGVFGLAIYCVSLNDKDLTESDLSSLFEDLPDRCIVLLEDIDSAGLKHEEETKTDAEKSADASGDKDKEKEKEKEKDGAKPAATGAISLSALLNVIDGAAAHEGHVLIMTTNTPETLDAALIRPGRIDHQVSFTLASRSQIHETFLRMYSATPEEAASAPISRFSSSNPTSISSSSPSSSSASASASTKRPRITDPVVLEKMAQEFAQKLPEGELSPAEVQGYLLRRKKEPERAVREVEGWWEELGKGKRRGKRLVGAQ